MQTSETDVSAKTILVVDDAEAIRKMICAMLTQIGYHCVEACDGTEALRVLDEVGHVELVLTDMMMPNMTGAELANRLSRIKPGIRILFMSGFTDDPMVRTVERLSSLFIPKPFTAETLTSRVRQALDDPWLGISGSDGCHAG